MIYPVCINGNILDQTHINEDKYNLSFWLRDMLRMAEDLYGPRDPSYSVSHIDTGHEISRIMFSGNNSNNIYIRLETDPADWISQALYQLAHETVHLLAPVRGKANNLEEGVATYFAGHYMKVKMSEQWNPGMESYEVVLRKVQQTLVNNPYCIRELRREYPYFYNMDKNDVYEMFKHHLNMKDVKWLLTPFDR